MYFAVPIVNAFLVNTFAKPFQVQFMSGEAREVKFFPFYPENDVQNVLCENFCWFDGNASWLVVAVWQQNLWNAINLLKVMENNKNNQL